MKNKTFMESDLGAAAFLVVRGFKLIDLVRVGSERYGFCFDDAVGNAAEAAMGYLQGECVSARELVAAEKNLKGLLYAKKNMRSANNGNGNGYGKGSASEYGNRSGK
jgi:hypothetical protein